MTIKSFGLTENQVAHAVSMWADDKLTGNLYSLYSVLCNKNVRDNIIGIDPNVEADETFLDGMVEFIKSLDMDYEVYAVYNSWEARETIRIEGIIAFAP